MVRLVKLFLLLLVCLLFDYEGVSSSSSSSDVIHLCSDDDKTALLQFKRLFDKDTPVLLTWKEEVSVNNTSTSDCCSWEGVVCDSSGHVLQLHLPHSNLYGTIPSNSTLFQLSHLQILDLSHNDFNGSAISPASGFNFPNLWDLDLSFSNFAGSITHLLTNLTGLSNLDLSSNKLTGSLPSNITRIQSLNWIRLRNNSISGTLPSDLFELPILEYLDLSSNQLSGTIPSITTGGLQNSMLRFIDLSYNHLQGSLPKSILHLPSLSELQLSNNNLSGTLEPLLFPNSTKLTRLDLSHNSFERPLPHLPPSMIWFFISHNKLVGDIPLSYCYFSRLAMLNLSHNNLSGVIPECITYFSPHLLILDLGMNRFHGTIPAYFPEGSPLISINLKGNYLTGQVPRSMANCRNLEVLDLGNNKINDTFPYWLQSLPELQVLVLRHNKFHGLLGLSSTKMVTPFPKLRIFDLSHNEFIGTLPSNYFHRLNAMRNVNHTSIGWLYMGNTLYDDTIEITLKGVDSELPRILKIFASIDLSDNKFEGEIPNDIGNLVGIQSLNLSSNALTGHVPLSLANLTLLESLDLSSNQLSGVIPQELTRITTLAVFNLSSNHLAGPIPRGFQFNTFENSSYGGNLGLCGLPLSKKCSDDGEPHDPPSREDEEEEGLFDGFGWKDVLLGYGCGLAFGLGFGFVMFSTGKPKRLMSFVEEELLRMAKRTRKPRGQGYRNGPRRG